MLQKSLQTEGVLHHELQIAEFVGQIGIEVHLYEITKVHGPTLVFLLN